MNEIADSKDVIKKVIISCVLLGIWMITQILTTNEMELAPQFEMHEYQEKYVGVI
ncbi:hypothetical protein [Calidifontibacillus erzurumensis]|uniref:hypothetical protein n=1 Tax=Calidifontibacillus erzurumensis TaxID=2741433 RepID=UPI0035B5371D